MMDEMSIPDLFAKVCLSHKPYFKAKIAKHPFALLDLNRPSRPLMSKCHNFNVNFQTSYHDVKLSVYRSLNSVRPCFN